MMDELKKKLTPNCTEGLLKNLKEFIRLSAAAPAEMMLSIPAQITSAIISILNNPQQSGKNKVSVLLVSMLT